jgi:hypothetical protein
VNIWAYEGGGKWGGEKNRHYEEHDDLYSSPNIIRVIKLRRMGRVGNVARIVREEVHTGFWWGNLRERDRFEDPGVDGG